MNNYLLIAVNVLFLTACGGSEYTEIEEALITKSSDGVGAFYDCFGSNYYDAVIVPEDAYQQAECFISLARESKRIEENTFNDKAIGADPHTILQYANSWYAIAAEQGYPLANYHLGRSQLALYALEGQLEASENENYELLASEKLFNLLDVDGDSALTLEEVLADHELTKAFTSADLDNNGQMNIAEYLIYWGEATAAGHDASVEE